MRYLVLAAFLLGLAAQAVNAQDPSAERAGNEFGGWKTVLEPGALARNSEIIPVEGGFAVSAESFSDPAWFFDSDWQLLDPETGAWTDYEIAPDRRALLDVNEELLELLNIADLVPDDPRIKYQLIDGGKKLAFLLPDDYEFDGLSMYTTALIVNPATRTKRAEYVWYCQGPPNAELVVWDFPDQNLSVICNVVIRHIGASTKAEGTYDFIGRIQPSALQLVSHSPDHRYWILGEEEVFHDDSGPFYIYDRHTELTFVLVWSLPWTSYREIVVWLSDTALLAYASEYILYVDIANKTRREFMREALAALPGEPALRKPALSNDGTWLLVATEDGSLFLRNVSDSLAATVDLPSRTS